MQVRLKFVFLPALITGLLLAIPDTVIGQSAEPSQDPSSVQGQMQVPEQAPAPMPDQMQQDQAQDSDVMQGQDQGQGQDQPPAPSGRGSVQRDQNERPPMSELPPPLKPSPNIQGPGPNGGGNPNSPPGYPPNSPPGYGNPRYGTPPYGNRGYGNAGPGNSGDPNETSENNAVARISLIHGDVSTQRGDSGDWSAAQLNAPVMSGDRVSTGDKARAELQLDYANILRISEHTQANITTLTRSQIQIQLGHGMANYTVLRNSDANAEIDTPNVSIRTERRDASFRILVTADDHTEVLVRSGEIEITTPQGGTRVGANQFITIRGTGDQTQYRIGEAPARDDWDQWNTDRDRMIGNSASRKHTNDYYVGSQDLDNNGSWQDVPDYGQAWFPNEGPDWAPYRAGNWVWEPYWGWTWVSYEPWGWAPYHYGRWFQYNGAWGWWPGPVYGYPYYRPLWAPAYVSFFGFGGGFGIGFGWGSIGWFPIGPCDFFHPWWGGYRGRFGYTGFNGYNRGGFAPLHGGNRFSNVRLAQSDSHFRGATSVAGNEFGKGGGHFQTVNHASMQGAHFATGNLPVTPTRASLSASGRPAAASTLSNRGGNQHFFSSHGTSTAASGHSFAREQAQVSGAMRQNGISPINGNGNQRGNESRNNEGRSNNARPAEPGARGFNQSGENAARSNTETRSNPNLSSGTRLGSTANSAPARESGNANNGGWQKFSPMAPRSSAEQSAGRSATGGEPNRGPYGSPRGSSGYPGSEGRGYSGSRPPLNMRQPIVTPRSYGGRSGGYPGYGGGRSAPSYGGHSAPSSHSGGAPHGGGSSHGGGGSHGGGHR
jgi:hypothetical protein